MCYDLPMTTRRVTLTAPPSRPPSLTRAQKTFVSDRKRDLERALDDARDELNRGEGRPFDGKRIAAEIRRRVRAKAAKRTKKA